MAAADVRRLLADLLTPVPALLCHAALAGWLPLPCRPMYLLGYLASQSKVYLMDKDFSVLPYSLLLSVVEYKTLVLRGDMETAAEVLATIPEVGKGGVSSAAEGVGVGGESVRTTSGLRLHARGVLPVELPCFACCW